MRTLQRLGCGVFAILILNSSASYAIEKLDISLGSFTAKTLNAENLQLAVQILPTGLGLTATADSLMLSEPIGQLNALRLSCSALVIQSAQVRCDAGKLAFSHDLLGSQSVDFQFDALPEKDKHQIRLTGISLRQGSVVVAAEIQANDWQVEVEGKGLQLAELTALLQADLPENQQQWLAGWQPTAVSDMQLEISGTENQPQTVSIALQLAALNFSNPTGQYVAESVSATLQFSAEHTQQWQWQQHLTLAAGQSYLQPVFLDFSVDPLEIITQGQADLAAKQFLIERFAMASASNFNVTGQAQFTAMQPDSITLNWQIADPNATYQTWLQPFLVGSALDALSLSGQLQGQITYQPDHYQLEVMLTDFEVNDTQQRFALKGLQGTFNWGEGGEPLPVNIAWQAASLGPFPIGPAQLIAEVNNQQIQLQQPLVLPLFDGALKLNSFNLNLAGGATQWQLDGLLTPVSMADISQALDWPILDGKLSGIIPSVRYQNDQIKMDGALQIGVFDGTAILRDLQLTSPFGSLPEFQANIDLQQMDLSLITRTFDFGRITGKVEGYIHDLTLANWQPVHFNAALKTAGKDPGKRRISQRAVDNLTQVGGGVGGVLSRGFMGFFEDFSYDKLGLSCRLQNDICQMDGIERTEQGYYIVKGGGLPPWINVMGFTRQVDWPELISRLQAVKDSEGPIIQ